jgi:Uma2 family endonuclease
MSRNAARTVLPSKLPMRVTDFDLLADGHPDERNLELVDGYVVMQSNPTGWHERIVSSIASPLTQHMDPRGCHTYQGGMRVQRSADSQGTDKVRPDIVVHCSPVTGRTYIIDPIIVVEVLSPSTMDIDRGPKREFYKSLPTVMHIAIVYQDEMRIELDRRTPDGWQRDILTTATDILGFDAIDFQLDLARAYFGTDLAA